MRKPPVVGGAMTLYSISVQVMVLRSGPEPALKIYLALNDRERIIRDRMRSHVSFQTD
jgi:hypothetical protein